MSRAAERAVVALVAAVVTFGFGGAAFAQDDAPAEGEPAEPIPIPLADIALRSEDLTGNLRRVEALLQPSYEIQAIEASIHDATGVLTELQRQLDAIDADRISTRMLDDHRLAWIQFDDQLEDWVGDLQSRWETLSHEVDELKRTHLEWEATRAHAVAASGPAALIALIDGQLQRVADTVTSLEARRDAVGSVLARVSQGREISARSLARIEDMARSLRGRMLNRDAPPLWKFAEVMGGDDLADTADEAGRYWLETLSGFVAARQGRFLFLLALFVVCLFTAVLARRAMKSWDSDSELDGARFVVSRPVSTAVAFAVLAMVLILDNTVGPVQDLVMMLAIVPIVRLGNGLIPVPARVALKGAMVLLILNRAWAMAPDGSFLRRILLIVVTALALAGASALLARWRKDDSIGFTGWWRFAFFLTGLAAVTVAASLIASVLGWSHLAERLTDGTIEGTFSALAWVTMAHVIVALAPLAVRSPLGILLPSVRKHRDGFIRMTSGVFSVAALFLWARASLRRFQLLEPFREQLRSVLSASVSVGGLDVSAGRVAAAFFILVGTWLAGRVVRFLLREEVLPRIRLPAGAEHSVVSVANYLIWGSGILLSAAAGGLSGTQLTVVFGALGVGIGFGLQNIVSNFVSGLILIFERPIKVGDRVQTKDHFGIVTSIGIRASMIRTFEGAEVVVPNSDLVSKEFVNWTRTDMTRRVEVLVHVALGSDPTQVLEILRSTATAHPKTLDNPAPTALMTGFGESALNFRLLVWCRIDDFLGVSSELHVSINDELRDAGIEIPYPQRDVHVTGEGTSASGIQHPASRPASRR